MTDTGIATTTDTDTKTSLMKLFKCLLHNDDVNDMDDVVHALQETFRFEIAKAVSVMMEAHENNVGICKVESMEHCEFHRDKLIAFGLTSTIEPVE